eukprot:221149-Pleurochrysis_carterae.AAC.1
MATATTLPGRRCLYELRDALYMPGLCATLVSPKAIFQKQGIRTYLNDELRLYFRMTTTSASARTPQLTPSRLLLTPSCTR